MERRIIEFGLRTYQKDADDNINSIFAREPRDDGKSYDRFAGVVLPTGGGKSFVALSQIMTFGKQDKSKIEIDENGVINNSKMIYVAPSHEILNQVKLHFVKNVLLSIDGLESMSVSEIDEYLKTNLEGIDFPGINSGEEIPLLDDASASEKKNAILRKLEVKDIDALVLKAFPNLKFCCYAGVRAGDGVKSNDIADADFIITDEAHRLGATTWGKNFFDSLRKNKNAKLLAITATPERTDSMELDMFSEIAREIYDEDTILPEEYMAQEIYVMDAMRDGIVLAPNVRQTDATLALSKQYEELYDRFKEMKPTDKKRAELEEILKQMDEIIGFEARNMTKAQIEKAVDEKTKDLVSDSFKEGRGNVNGKYIAFIPSNFTKDSDEPVDSADYLKKWKERILKDFEGVLDENGNPVKVTVSFLTSNSSIMLDENGNPVTPSKSKRSEYKRIVNSDVIKDFEDASSESGGIKIIITNNILNEGVHVDGIDGSLMYRPAGTSTIYLQQSGRCISSLDPSKPLSEQSKTQIIDMCGNSFDQVSNGTGSKSSVDYDLKKLMEIDAWLREQNAGHYGTLIMPDINRRPEENTSLAKAQAEQEARLAIAIKRIQQKYKRYAEHGLIPIKDGEKIREILKIAGRNDLFNVSVPERTESPSEEELVGRGFLEFTEAQKRFIDLYDQYRAKDVRMSSAERINKLANIVRIIKTYESQAKTKDENGKGIIKFPQGILIQGLSAGKKEDESKEIATDDAKSSMLEDFLRENFDDEISRRILADLKNYDLMQTSRFSEIYHDGEKYDLGIEMAFVRGKIYTSQYDALRLGEHYKLFDNFDLKDLILLGIIQDGKSDVQKLITMSYNYQGAKKKTRNVYGIENFLDSDGRWLPGKRMDDIKVGLIDRFEECSLYTGERFFKGYNREGFNARGYDAEGFDQFGFDEKGVHKVTLTHVDERGFYLAEDGRYLNIRTQSEYDLLGYNIYGFDKEGFERPNPPTLYGIGGYKSPKYSRPLWHERFKSGEYSKHGYIFKQRLKHKEKTHDAHGFETLTRHSDPDDPRFSGEVLREDGIVEIRPFFYSDGCTKKNSTSLKAVPRKIEDYYLDGLDIDGYDKDGFKKVTNSKGETIYVHRDTSGIHDRRGRYKTETGELKENYLISDTKLFIKNLLERGVPAEAFFRQFSDLLKIPIDQMKKQYSEEMKEAFKLMLRESPDAFSKDANFKGLLFYCSEAIESTERRERLEEFFEYCPVAKEVLMKENAMNIKALRNLQKTKNKRGLTKEEQEKESKRNADQELYDRMDLE